jgi:signal transduction histidine kinase
VEQGYARVVSAVRSPVGDAIGLAAVAGLVLAGAWLAAGGDATARQPWQVGALLLVVGVAVLWWRRRFPLAVLVITASTAVAYYLLDFPAGAEPLAFLVALYAAASEGYRWVSWLAVPAAPLVVETAELAAGHDLETSDLVLVGVTLLAVVALGELSRARRAYLREVEQRARTAECGRVEEAARRVAEERLRIARELHDVLAHHLSVISIQAGAALLRGGSRPELTGQALETIRAAAAQALGEVRATLGVLRGTNGTEVAGEPAPAPTLTRLPELVDRARAAGVRAELTIDDPMPGLPAAVQSGVYRIVQEALTNAVRHAQATMIRVDLAYTPGQLRVQIRDDGRGATGDGHRDGHGLRGMRERISTLGGRLEAGPLDSGGFRVQAWLPTGRPS